MTDKTIKMYKIVNNVKIYFMTSTTSPQALPRSNKKHIVGEPGNAQKRKKTQASKEACKEYINIIIKINSPSGPTSRTGCKPYRS